MKYFCFIILFLGATQAGADCKVLDSQGQAVNGLSDVLFKNLNKQDKCPKDVFELKDLLIHDGLEIRPSMVANRGHHNPKFGSFSLFERAFGKSESLKRNLSGDELFFGHFTRTQSGTVELDQAGHPGQLMVELIAWDSKKQLYNFYELIGAVSEPLWLYRGDSTDALKDNQFVHRQPNPGSPQFGKTMRCSACHASGGPIMKELQSPHNDWWTPERPLPFAANRPSEALSTWLVQLEDSSEFSASVQSGITKLEQSSQFQAFKKSLTLQEQLKPLFCTSEINLISGKRPLEDLSEEIEVSTEFWVNPLLATASVVQINKADYIDLLKKEGFSFPETNRLDADHPWLAPVKGHSDLKAIESLVVHGTIDSEFVADVLAIDFKNPLFSNKRCSLLTLLPETAGPNWKSEFIASLQENGNNSAMELHSHLTEMKKNEAHHQKVAYQYIEQMKQRILEVEGLESEIEKLQEKRLSVFQNEISKNPMGQILEPGFRVIFPLKIGGQ